MHTFSYQLNKTFFLLNIKFFIHFFFFFSSRRRHTRLQGDWSSDVCSSDLIQVPSAKTNFAPSVRSIDTTLRPRSVEASTATFLIAFAFCSSLRCRFSRNGQNSRPIFLKSC